jgi:hypothetical protein
MVMFEFRELFVSKFKCDLLDFGFVDFDVFGLGNHEGRSLSDQLALIIPFVCHINFQLRL